MRYRLKSDNAIKHDLSNDMSFGIEVIAACECCVLAPVKWVIPPATDSANGLPHERHRWDEQRLT